MTKVHVSPGWRLPHDGELPAAQARLHQPIKLSHVGLVALLLGVGMGLAAWKNSDMSDLMHPAGWGGAMTGVALMGGLLIRRKTVRLMVPGAEPEAPQHMQELVARTAQGVAQELLNRRDVTAAQIVEGNAPNLALMTAFMLVRSGTVTRDCNGVDSLNWGTLSVTDAQRSEVVAGLHLRDGLNTGSAVDLVPVTLARQVSSATLETIRRDARWQALAETLHQRYFGTFRLGVVGNHVVRLVRQDGAPTHMHALMDQAYETAVRDLVAQGLLTRQRYDEALGGAGALPMATALSNLAAYHLLRNATVYGRTLRLTAAESMHLQFHEEPSRSRNDLTYTENSVDMGDGLGLTTTHPIVTNEAIIAAIYVNRPGHTQAAIVQDLVRSLTRQNENPALRYINDPIRAVAKLCLRQYSSGMQAAVDRVLPPVAEQPVRRTAPARQAPLPDDTGTVPSRPLTRYLERHGLPIHTMQRTFSDVSPAPSELIKMNYGLFGALPLIKHYYTVVEGEGSCLFAAISLALYDTERYQQQLQAAAHSYVRDNGNRYSGQRYMDWGTDEDIDALSHIYARPIHVILTGQCAMQFNATRTQLMPHMPFGRAYQATPVILAHDKNVHFYACLPHGSASTLDGKTV
jgi:hypothetical protein